MNRNTRWSSSLVFLAALIIALLCLGPKGLRNATDALVFLLVVPLSCAALVVIYRVVGNRGDAVLVDTAGLTIRHGLRRVSIPWSDFEKVTVVPGQPSGSATRSGSQMLIGRPSGGHVSRRWAGYHSRTPSPVDGTTEILRLDVLDAQQPEVLAAIARCAGDRWQPAD